jgi:exodeoxyribonuclease-3
MDFLEKESPDFLCLQETRAFQEQANLITPGLTQYWNPAKRAGYSGTAILSKFTPLNVTCGMGVSKHDDEGRVLTMELSDFFLVNVYVPNSKNDLARLPYRSQEWDVDFLIYLKALEKKKPVVLCGDMNVAHQEIDLTNPAANIKNHGFTPEERAGFDNLVKAGLIDTGGHYTWWSTFMNCRKRNIGWRIDYFCISESLRGRLADAFILKEVMGSDHCPVGIVLK